MNENVSNLQKLKLNPETALAIEPALPRIKEYTESASLVLGLALAGKKQEAENKYPEFMEKFEALEKELEVLGDKIQADAKLEAQKSDEAVKKANIANALSIFAGVLVAFIGSMRLIRGLETEFNAMINRLSSESQRLNGGAKELSTNAENLSVSSTQSTSAVAGAASAVEEINAMLKKSEESMGELGVQAEKSKKAAAEGQGQTTRMIEAVALIGDSNQKIMQQVEQSNQQFSEIVQLIEEIGSKTKVINDIVFQTKLLSFNASVEAARAGEMGKGFAVVAEEVGSLAKLSGEASLEISELLTKSTKRVNEIVVQSKEQIKILLNQGEECVKNGTQEASRCNEALTEIYNQAHEVSTLVQGVAQAIEEQGRGVYEISKTLNEVETISQRNTQTSQTTKEFSTQLLQQAESIESVVKDLGLLIQGKVEGDHSLVPNNVVELQGAASFSTNAKKAA